MFSSNDHHQQDGHGILGSFIGSIRRKYSKIRERMLLPKVAGNSKSNNCAPSSQYFWETERGDSYLIASFKHGWALERMGRNSNYRLRNPTTHRVLELSNTNNAEKSFYLLAVYLSSRKTFKLVVPSPKGNMSFKVLDVDEDDAWRRLNFPLKCKVTNAIKWLASTAFDGLCVVVVFPKTGGAVIVFLEAETEKIWSINVSQEFVSNRSKNIVLISWEGKPALARRLELDFLCVWVVEDYRNKKLAEDKILVDLTGIKDHRRYHTPFSFYHGKLWMHLDYTRYSTFDIVSKVVADVDAPEKKGAKFPGLTSLLCGPRGQVVADVYKKRRT